MLRWFKKFFIPHQHNNHRPHILRIEGTLIILSLVLLIEIYFLLQVFFIVPRTGLFSAIVPDALVDLTNLSRQVENLSSLKPNSLLSQAAQLKAEDMAANGYFTHTSPAGLTPWYWLDKVGYHYSFAGENLAINFIDSQDIENAWMNSPLHRDNILNNNFTEIGIGVAQGIYQGQETNFAVQMFGRPAAEETAVAPVAPETQSPSPKPQKQTKPPAPKIIQNEVASANELFIAVKGAASAASSSAPQNKELAKSSLAADLLSAPRRTTDFLLLTLLTILALALALTIFIKIKIQHPVLIVNGVILLLIISSVLWANQYIALLQAKIF